MFGPGCADPLEINDWLKKKKILMHMINNKIDFSIKNEEHIRQFEKYIPTIPLGNGVFSDTGSRVRLNTFKSADDVF